MAIQPWILDAVSASPKHVYKVSYTTYTRHVGQKNPDKQTEGERKQLIKEC